MLNKNELDKIVINSLEELKALGGQDLTEKYLILNISEKNVKLDTLSKCIIEGDSVICQKLTGCHIEGMKYVYADEIYLSSMQKCKRIQCGSFDDEFTIKASQFSDCEEITINEATVTDCIFHRLKILSLTSTSMDNCLIFNVVCDKDSAITMEDGEMTNISFENIELRNDSYLIEGYGDPWVEDSVFVNIRTSRDDCELFHMEEERGRLFKKKVEFSFVDEESCSGLELISVLNSINLGGNDNGKKSL